jgi:hypothetical protein
MSGSGHQEDYQQQSPHRPMLGPSFRRNSTQSHLVPFRALAVRRPDVVHAGVLPGGEVVHTGIVGGVHEVGNRVESGESLGLAAVSSRGAAEGRKLFGRVSSTKSPLCLQPP